MARTREPTQLQVVKGGYVKNPQRRPKREPKPAGPVGNPPKKNPSVDWRECWKEIAQQVCPGVLGSSDRVALELAARLLAEYRTAPLDTPAAKIGQLTSLLAKFGMTPADRARVQGDGGEEEESDPYA